MEPIRQMIDNTRRMIDKVSIYMYGGYRVILYAQSIKNAVKSRVRKIMV